MSAAPFIDGRHVDVDLPLHVTEASEGDGTTPTFVMLHGFGASSYAWRHWTPKLAERGRVLCVDYKGFGAAPKPADDRYGPEDQAELVIQLIDRLGLKHVTLIGHSLGGGIALLAAERLCARETRVLDRMVLISSPAYRQPLPPFVRMSERPRLTRFLIRAIGPRRLIRTVFRSIVRDPSIVTEEMVDAYAHALTTREGVNAAMAAGRRILPVDIDQASEKIRDVDVPTLLIWGDWERVVPGWVGERLAEDLPNARLVVLERCGHVPPEEKPDEGFAVLSTFLDETPQLPQPLPPQCIEHLRSDPY